MKKFLNSFFGHSVNNTLRIPAKVDFHEEKKEKLVTKRLHQVSEDELLCFFAESIKKMINFDVPRLKKDDPCYEEFSKEPTMSLIAAIDRISKYTEISFSVYPGAIILLRRLLNSNKELILSTNNMIRLTLTSLLISAKFIEDTPPSNFDFAVSLGYDAVFSISNIRNLFFFSRKNF